MKRRKKSPIGRIIAFIVLLLFIVVVTVIILSKDDIEKIITKKIATAAVEQIIHSNTGISVDIEEIESQMEENDKKEFEEIVDKFTDTEKLKECIEIYKKEGTSAVKDYVKSEIDKNDIVKLKELYDKYEDSIPLNNE